MRQVNYADFLCGAEFDAWLQRARQARESLVEAVAGGQPIRWNNKIWKDLKKLLAKGNYDKCMYCDGNYGAGSYGDADHYRPKGKVTEDREGIDHPGYYWLAYEWQNILLSCEKCNRPHESEGKSHPGKLNEFPVRGERKRNPEVDPDKWWEELSDEEPLLLHPYYDKPANHIRAGRYGVVYGTTERGRATIEICDLNRPELCNQRLYFEERQLSGRPVTMMFRMRRNEPIEDLLFEPRDCFTEYLNCRLVACAEKLLEA